MENFLIIIYMTLTIASSQIPPGSPVIDGPPVLVLNSQITLTCTSARGDPPPTVTWLKDDTEITTGVSTSSAGTAVTTSLTFTASLDDHFEVYECQAENGVLQNPLTTTKFIEVLFSPQAPTLSGPTTLTPGQLGTWKCISANGYPPGKMTMRNKNKNTQFTSEFSTISVLDQKSFDVTGTLIWSPVTVYNGDTICCDVKHTTTLGNTPQTVCSQITIAYQIAINAPVTQYIPIIQSSVTLQCAVTQGTASQIIWIKDSVQLNIDSNSRLSGGTVATESLTITNVLQSDGGNYVCRGIDAVTGNVVNTHTIKVNPVDLIAINATVTQYSPILQSSVTLQCAVTQGSASQIIWIKDNVQLNIGSNSRLTGGTVVTESLTIANVQQSDGGNYVCRGIDAVTGNTVNTDIISVTPVDLIAMNAPVTQYNPILQSSVNLQCVVTQGTASQIIWIKDDIQLNISSNSRLSGGTVANESLTVGNVQQSDGGKYVCRGIDALTGNVVNTHTITVNPVGSPPVTTIPKSTYNQLPGKQIILGCSVSSPNSPIQQVQWTLTNYGGQVTDHILVSTSNGKYSGSTTSSPSLTINNVASTDEGTYSCKARNLVGTSRNNPTTTLTVTDSKEEHSLIYLVIGIVAILLLFIVIFSVFCYRRGFKQGQVKEKEDVSNTDISQHAPRSNQLQTTENHSQDLERNYDGLDPDRQEMHVYNTPQDNEDNNHYMTLPADHAYIDPIG